MYLTNTRTGTIHLKDERLPTGQTGLCGKYPLLPGGWLETTEAPPRGRRACKACAQIAKSRKS